MKICELWRDLVDNSTVVGSPPPPTPIVYQTPLDPDDPPVTTEFKPALWYPKSAYNDIKMPTSGTYRKGFPEGCVIHYTDGWDNNIKNSIDYAVEQKHTYFLIDRAGTVAQCFPLNRYGSHAGESTWKTFPNETRLSRFLVGIEVMGAGLLTSIDGFTYKSYFGQKFSPGEYRKSPSVDNIRGGVYRKFTDDQEMALFNLIRWMYKEGRGVFSIDNVLGHDEVAPYRKVDPGGALSRTMPNYRKYLSSQLI